MTMNSRHSFPQWDGVSGLVTKQKPRPAVPTLREAEAAGSTLHVDVDQKLPGESAGGDSLHNVLLPDAPLPEARPDGSGVEQRTSPLIAEQAMVVVFGLGSGSGLAQLLCSNLLI